MGTTKLFFLRDDELPHRHVFFFASWNGGADEAEAITSRFLRLVVTLAKHHGSDVLRSDEPSTPGIGRQFVAHGEVLAAAVARLEIEYPDAIAKGRLKIHPDSIPEELRRTARRKMAALHAARARLQVV